MKKVVKFGGSSLADAAQFRKAAEIIHADKGRRYVVPSAPGRRSPSDQKVTDMLYACYESAVDEADISRKLRPIRARYQEITDGLGLKLDLDAEFKAIQKAFVEQEGSDYAASRGEYLNGLIMAAYLEFPFVDAADVICFDEDGVFDEEMTDLAMKAALADKECAVIPGFYGAREDGTIQTFSRGGSDITGSIVARAVHADLYENWTDVSGFLVADPNIIENPETIETITYRELRELSYMGATVLHADSIFPLRQEGIPIQVRNTNRPQDLGTLIVEDTCKPPKFTITGIAGKKGFCAINIEKDLMNEEIGFGRKVLQVFEENNLSFEHVPSGIDTFTVIVSQKEFMEREQHVISGLHRAVHPDTIDLESDLALIAIVGRGMRDLRGTAGRIFSALAHANVNVKMIDQGSSELNIIVGVKCDDFERAIRAIYDIFVLTHL